MKAILMAGGFGTRLRPLTISQPKPMVPVANLPIMEHVVSLLARHGINQITSLLYYQPEQIKSYFGDGSAFGVDMDYCLPKDDYGTAGAVRAAISDPSEPVLVISGDLITDFNLTEAVAWHHERRSEATILLTRIDNPLPYGIVITNPDGRIVRFLEKPSWGEAFSDTINTGIYILEPSALKLIPQQSNYDFSQNLFPLMLSRQMGLYGRITEGYWKDVGNVGEYRNVHADFMSGDLTLYLKGDRQLMSDATVYRGQNVHIADDVNLSGTVILDDDVHVEAGAKLADCCVGRNTRIGRDSELTNSVVWPDNTIGERCEIGGAIVCTGSSLGNAVKLGESVIVSNGCIVGDEVIVKANCKIWPNKTVEEGAIVSSSIVWGDKWNRELFTDSKLTGLALTEVSTGMAVRLGEALGATLGQDVSVATSRDASDMSRLLRRGLLSGMLSAGVHVNDLETAPIPVVRYELTRGNHAAGIYVRHHPTDYRQIDIILFDGNGLDMPNSKLKKIERNYFGEDYALAEMDKIGHLDRPQRVLPGYRRSFMEEVDADLIRQAGFKIVVDYSNGAACDIFSTLFSRLGISSTEINAYLDPRKFSASVEEHSQSVVQLSAIVRSLHADVGFHLNAAAEKLTVIDDDGLPLDSQLLLLIVTDLFLQTHPAKTIAVPVAASMGVEEIAAKHNVEVKRVANTHWAMMDARLNGKADFVGGTRGGFIFPGFQTGADAMCATMHILEMMARTKKHLSQLRREHDRYFRRTVSVPCPWSKKGQVMRHLITSTDQMTRELVDGVLLKDETGWVLLTPDRLQAAFNVHAESTSETAAQALLERYEALVIEGKSG